MAENQETKSRRDAFNERLKTKYPDREYTDEEALFGQIDDDYADYEKQLGEYRDREQQVEESFARDPRNAQFFSDMANGRDPWIAVIERMGSDGVIELMNDPEKKAAYEEANRTYAERLAEEKEIEEQYEKNKAASDEVIDQLNAKYGEATVDAAIGMIDEIWHNAVMGIVKPEHMEIVIKAIKHDADVENARSEGEVAGRNAKIEEKLRQQKSGDGMPAMGGSSAAAIRPKSKGGLVDYAERLGIRM